MKRGSVRRRSRGLALLGHSLGGCFEGGAFGSNFILLRADLYQSRIAGPKIAISDNRISETISPAVIASPLMRLIGHPRRLRVKGDLRPSLAGTYKTGQRS